jgi:Rod binding domain-containing protein
MMPGGLQVAKAAATVLEAKKDLDKLKKATDGLESFMFKSLLKSAGGKKGLFGSKMPGADIYRDMFESNMSDLLASRGSLGISNSIYNKVAPLVLSQAQQRIHQSSIEKKI